jgi:chromosome segregation ATPase
MRYNLFDCRSTVRNPTNEKRQQTDKERLSVSYLQNRGQETKKENQAHKCTSCTVMVETVNKLTDDLRAVQKKIQAINEVVAERDALLITLKRYDRVDKELEQLRECVNEDKYEILKLNVKIVDLEEEHRIYEKNARETIKGLSEAVARISSENDRLKMVIIKHKDCILDETVYRSDEAVENLGAAVNRNIQNNQVSYSFPSRRDPGSLNTTSA